MTFASNILLVELVMSIDRIIESAKAAKSVAGEWNASTILGHISQVDAQVWQARVQLMVEAQNAGLAEPKFVWWEPDPAVTKEMFSELNIQDAAGAAMQARTQLVTFLNTLTAEQWDACGIHSDWGQISVRELIFQTLSHDEEHRASLV